MRNDFKLYLYAYLLVVSVYNWHRDQFRDILFLSLSRYIFSNVFICFRISSASSQHSDQEECSEGKFFVLHLTFPDHCSTLKIKVRTEQRQSRFLVAGADADATVGCYLLG